MVAPVKSHLPSILTKLGLRDRAQIVVFAYESRLVEAGDRDIGHDGLWVAINPRMAR